MGKPVKITRVKNVFKALDDYPPLPKTIKVGAIDFTVKAWNPLAASNSLAIGLCDRGTATILVKEGLPPQMTAMVLLHEVLHAVHEVTGLEYVAGGEEPLVNALGYGLAQVWRDNPDFINFMEACYRR